ncbi:Hypothetical predicted protein [Pelobates cultripes]|uniref:Uncharacterized protein n=1 Tax=Pelobates cultripes TaxID=61616 RepID=A0AAD1VUL7_PELCU|nr:Hypothetical predicted protein [Pelobates cultripes]
MTKSKRADRRKDIQDGDDTSNLSDGQSDYELSSSKYSEAPVTERSLHKMLQGLRATITADFHRITGDLRKEISNIGDRTNHLENKTDELCIAHNEVVDKVQKLSEENSLLRDKLADMEDRSRRQNIRFRGIPDDVTQEALPAHILSICNTLVPGLPNSAWAYDRMHRLPRPAHLPKEVPKDVIVRFHYFAHKETLLAAARKALTLPEPHQRIALFADLSAATMEKRRSFITVTKTLRNNNVAYKWGYPTKLIIWRQGRNHIATDPTEGMKLISAWGLWTGTPQLQSKAPDNASPRKLQADWQMAKSPANTP